MSEEFYNKYVAANIVLPLDAYIAIGENEVVRLSDLIDSYRKINSVKWQPIETAPKTGEALLGYDINGAISIMCWLWEKWREMSYEGGAILTPTHWMPLPEPPKEDR